MGRVVTSKMNPNDVPCVISVLVKKIKIKILCLFFLSFFFFWY